MIVSFRKMQAISSGSINKEKTVLRFAIVSLLFLATVSRSSADVILNFSGLQDGEGVLGFYDPNDGTSANGSNGPNYGISFESSVQARVSTAGGGYETNMANLPSGANAAISVFGPYGWATDYASTFTSFSFDYSSPSSLPFRVEVRSGIIGSGTLLGSLDLGTTGTGCEQSTAQYSCWESETVSFTGNAQSIVLRNAGAGSVYFTNLDFGTSSISTPAPAVPEPSSGSLLLLGIACCGLILCCYRRGYELLKRSVD